MTIFAPFPIPVITPEGDGYVVYIESNPMWENDCITVALCNGGQWRHFNSGQIKSWHNATYDITKTKPNEPVVNPRPASEPLASVRSPADA